VSPPRRFLGVFVNTYAVQSEGITRVLDNLQSVGCTAIVVLPVVSRPVQKGAGVRTPVLHVDGYRRTFGRPIFGRRDLHMKSYRVLQPRTDLYVDTPYLPRWEPIPAGLDATLPHQVVEEARRRDLLVYTHVAPFLAPVLQPEDRPRYPDGKAPEPPQVSIYGAPASPAIRAYGRALALDTLRGMPAVDGLFMDWAEFGAYAFQDLFASFDGHMPPASDAAGVSWTTIKAGIRDLWDRLHRLTLGDLRPPDHALARLIENHAGWQELLALKRHLIISFYREVRQAMDNAGFSDTGLVPRGWPPPWNAMTGLDYAALAGCCSEVTPKLFAFDYCAIPRWYGQVLKSWNPDLGQGPILDALVHWLDMVDEISPRRFSRYNIPASEERQPMGVDHYTRRVQDVLAAVPEGALVRPFAHAHMPLTMWQEMVSALDRLPCHGFWIQMYSYLSDDKLAVLRH
jgi:hypothetical protein